MPRNSDSPLTGWRLVLAIVAFAILTAGALAVGWYGAEGNPWIGGAFTVMAVLALVQMIWQLVVWGYGRFKSRV